MKNKQIIFSIFAMVIIIGAITYMFYSKGIGTPFDSLTSTETYVNDDFGFNFALPTTWKGYSVIKTTWTGNMLTKLPVTTGTKIIIRNPKWTTVAPYEDIPILIFTIAQWNSYQKEDFAISAAPIMATELARNNKYVFSLPPRWDFDYSLDFKEAQEIVAGKPLTTFNLNSVGSPQGKLNINVICEQALSYMSFTDGKSADLFVSECKEGMHPEVIEKYRKDMNLGDGAMI